MGGGVAESTRGRKLMTSSVMPHVAAQPCELEVAAAAGVCKGSCLPTGVKILRVLTRFFLVVGCRTSFFLRSGLASKPHLPTLGLLQGGATTSATTVAKVVYVEGMWEHLGPSLFTQHVLMGDVSSESLGILCMTGTSMDEGSGPKGMLSL